MSIARYGRLVVELADMAYFIPMPAPVWLASVGLLGDHDWAEEAPAYRTGLRHRDFAFSGLDGWRSRG